MVELLKHDIVNGLVQARGYTTLLEVSTAHSGFVFDRFDVDHKERVRCTDDIWGDGDDGIPTTIAAPAAEIWQRLADDGRRFDLVFLDGVHTLEHCRRDLDQGFQRLTPAGCLVVHDCNPPDETFVGDVPKQGQWCGEMYRAFCELRLRRGHELSACVVDTDYGCGIVDPRPDVPGTTPNSLRMFSDFDDFDTRRHELLGLISPSQFVARFRQS